MFTYTKHLPTRPRTLRYCALATMALAAALAALAAPAGAATVSVEEVAGEPNLATLKFEAGAGEDNRVTISEAPPEFEEFDMVLAVVDEGAAITAGVGCSPGKDEHEVRCRMHRPKESDSGPPCTRIGCTTIPGTRWRAAFDVSLDDGTNTFDGRAFAGTYNKGIAMQVSSGSGSDRIFTGNGEDQIDPGAGNDEVRMADGYDRITVAATADGDDLYDGGRSLDKLSYSLRTEPIELRGDVVVAGSETDSLEGWFHVVGGSGSDVLRGGRNIFQLEGGAGDDLLSGEWVKGSKLYGGPGEDRLVTVAAAADTLNRLVGEEGDDTYHGGPGSDIIREAEAHEEVGPVQHEPPSPAVSGGDDVAHGGGGDDVIDLRAGRDAAYGEAGNDSLHGGGGMDFVTGARGKDLLIGGSGFDRLRGGGGSDRIFSGFWSQEFDLNENRVRSFPFTPVGDDRRDLVSCGRGRDYALVNPWDRFGACEKIRFTR